MAEKSRRQESLFVSAPLPPSSNHIYANAAKGRVLTKEARAYKEEVGNILMTQWAKKRCPEPPFAFYLHLRLPDLRRADLTNRIKLIEDAVFSHLGHDDSLVYESHQFKYVCPDNPGVAVELRHTERSLEAAV